MKKYFYPLMVALMAIVSCTFVSCSDDDNSPTGNDAGPSVIEINGTKRNISMLASLKGVWNAASESGEFTIPVDVEKEGSVVVDYYSFRFESETSLKVGDDVAKMNLGLTLLLANTDDPAWGSGYAYTSGKAVVTETNPDENRLTLRFENLRMSREGRTYSLNGTVTLPFFNNEGNKPADSNRVSLTVNGKTYVEPTGDIGTFSEFGGHTVVQIEIEVAPKETAGVQYYPFLSILFRADHFFPYMVSKGYTLTLHDDTWIGYIPAKGGITNYTRYVSGKIIFQGFSNGIVTLQLDNVTFADKNNQSNVITLNGTLDFEYSV